MYTLKNGSIALVWQFPKFYFQALEFFLRLFHGFWSQHYCDHNTKTLFAFYIMLTFAFMMQKQWWVNWWCLKTMVSGCTSGFCFSHHHALTVKNIAIILFPRECIEMLLILLTLYFWMCLLKIFCVMKWVVHVKHFFGLWCILKTTAYVELWVKLPTF